MWREPLAGNTGEDLEPHKPVHETTTDSCTGGNATKWDFPALVGSPAEFGRLIAEETEKWGKVIRAANIKAE